MVKVLRLLAGPGGGRGCFTNTFKINEDGAFSNLICYFKISLKFLNLEGHPNPITGSRVMAILLNWWILSNGGALTEECLQSTGLSSLVFFLHASNLFVWLKDALKHILWSLLTLFHAINLKKTPFKTKKNLNNIVFNSYLLNTYMRGGRFSVWYIC